MLTLFTFQQLTKLHRQFYHPFSEKLYNLLGKARPEDNTPETQKQLEEISRSCDPCRRIQDGTTRFKVSFGTKNILFNEEVIIDIIHLDRKPVLHMVDAQTHFSATRF